MKNVYEQFDTATKGISAYAVFKNDNYIGRIVVKYPKEGVGRLYVYVQEWDHVMIRGYVGGCGYDKVGAALASVYDNAKKEFKDNLPPLFAALENVTYNGEWRRNLESCGFTVHNVI